MLWASLSVVRRDGEAAVPLLPRARNLFVATPAWHEERVAPTADAWSVPYFLHRHLRARYGRRRLAADSVVFVAVFVDRKTLTQEANRQSEGWLRNGSSVLPLRLDGGRTRTIDLAPILAEGRIWAAAFGPQKCDALHGSALHTARIVFFDRAFGSCDERRGLMVPAHAVAAAASAAGGGLGRLPPPSYYATHNGWRNELFFYGRICKPYIDWPTSSVRYQLWKALRRVHESGDGERIIAEGVDVTLTVAPYAVADAAMRCQHCSYACKQCYVDPDAHTYRDAPHMAPAEFGEQMRQSEFCVVARGDDPQTPKLAEAILNGCVPAIVIDGRLPFEDRFNYSLAALRVPIETALRTPGALLDAIRATPREQRDAMRAYLHAHRQLFEYGRADGRGAEAAIVDSIFERTPLGASAVEAETEARTTMPALAQQSAIARVWARVDEAR